MFVIVFMNMVLVGRFSAETPKDQEELDYKGFTGFSHPTIGLCFHCKGYDHKDTFNNTSKRFHKECGHRQARIPAK